MRYYRMKLNTNAAMIKEHAKINLREYGLANRPIDALNNYMSRTMKNGLCFIAFREEDDTTTMLSQQQRDLFLDYVMETEQDEDTLPIIKRVLKETEGISD